MTVVALIVLLLKLSIVLSVFAIGLKATFADALHLFRRPVELGRALLAMAVIMPLFALVVVLTFDLPAPVKLALVVLSVSPIPPILPNKAIKAGGKENYTIGLLVAISLLSVILIPLTLKFFEWVSKVPLSIPPQTILITVLSTVLAPLLVGIMCRTLSSSFADRAAKPIALVGMILLVLCCLPILFTSTKAILILIGDGTLLALGAFAIVGLLAGHLLGGPKQENRPVLALAASTRHPAVALAIAHANFPEQRLTAPLVLIYLIISMILSIPYLSWIKRTNSAQVAREKQAQA